MAETATAGLAVELRQTSPIALDLAFTVAPGEFMALVGPSGSGKTTTLRAIAGHHRPRHGLVTCNGLTWLDTTAGIDIPARRRHVGMVFQSYALFPHLTAIENVMEALAGGAPVARRRQAGELLARVHLTGLDDAKPAQLSGGQQQRVAVARALARRPDALLLDEPFSAVDRPTRIRLYGELAEIRRQLSMPIILVTHDIDEAARLADTVTILAAGKIAARGPIGDMLSRLDLGGLIDRDDAGGILHGRILAHDAAAGSTVLDHPSGRLHHPLIDQPVGTKVRLRVRARDVALAVGEPGRLSIRNRLAATVTAIAEGPPPVVEVRLDAGGEALIASITRDAADALGLAVGQPVTALIKSMAFDRLSSGGDATTGRTPDHSLVRKVPIRGVNG